MTILDEKNIPAQQTQTQEPPRISCPHEDAGGAQCDPQTQTHRQKAPCANRNRLKKILGLPKASRLLRRSDFIHLRNCGRTLRGSKLAITVERSPISRLGITASKKYGNSPARAYFKRCVREIFRHLKLEFQHTLIINVRPLVKAPLTYHEIESEMRALLPLHPPTLIIRHRRENKKKCSLTPLQHCPGFSFQTYPLDNPEIPANTVLLSHLGEPLTKEDCKGPLLLLDGTWAHVEKMSRFIDPEERLTKKSIPAGWKTAYPRCQEVSSGLASIEALFAAYTILGWEKEHLLKNYHWSEKFISVNKELC